jgi:hypothetical protein
MQSHYTPKHRDVQKGKPASPGDIDAPNSRRRIACRSGRGNWERVKVILDLGYDVNHADAWGNTCLKYAREAGRPEMEALLVAYGATE